MRSHQQNSCNHTVHAAVSFHLPYKFVNASTERFIFDSYFACKKPTLVPLYNSQKRLHVISERERLFSEAGKDNRTNIDMSPNAAWRMVKKTTMRQIRLFPTKPTGRTNSQANFAFQQKSLLNRNKFNLRILQHLYERYE